LCGILFVTLIRGPARSFKLNEVIKTKNKWSLRGIFLCGVQLYNLHIESMMDLIFDLSDAIKSDISKVRDPFLFTLSAVV